MTGKTFQEKYGLEDLEGTNGSDDEKNFFHMYVGDIKVVTLSTDLWKKLGEMDDAARKAWIEALGKEAMEQPNRMLCIAGSNKILLVTAIEVTDRPPNEIVDYDLLLHLEHKRGN